MIEFTIHDGSDQPASKELQAGDGIFIGSGFLHSARALEPGATVAGFVFPITFFDIKLFENIHHRHIQPIIESGVTHLTLRASEKDDRPLISSMKELCSITEQKIGYELHCIEMICKIWRLLTVRIIGDEKETQTQAANRTQEQRLKEMVSFIHAHYDEHINVEAMAKSAGISRTECFRCFHAVLNKSPTEYLTEYRLSMATMLLTNTEQTLSEISYSCGFNSPSYFGKLFRELCGISPQKFRERQKAKV